MILKELITETSAMLKAHGLITVAVILETLFSELNKTAAKYNASKIILEHTEQHLRSAEKALVEKDEEIAKLKKALAERETVPTSIHSNAIAIYRSKIEEQEKEIKHLKAWFKDIKGTAQKHAEQIAHMADAIK